MFLQSPLGDYELIDFGNGRKLERFGPYLVERPEPRAQNPRAIKAWNPDWAYSHFAAISRWVAKKPGLPTEWTVTIDGIEQWLSLGDGGDTGISPEQVYCQRWVNQRLSGCYHLDDLSVLNLFAGSGGVTLAALKAGANVTHVDSCAYSFNLAQHNLAGHDVEWVFEDANAYADHIIREHHYAFDMIVLRPPERQRGPHAVSWDIKCDLGPLMSKLPQLLTQNLRGIWLSPQVSDWSTQSLIQFLRGILPGRTVEQIPLEIATRDGRVLSLGTAAFLYDDEDIIQVDGSFPSLSAGKIEERLDVYLDAVLSSRRTAAGPARKLADYSREQQEYVFRWVEVMVRTNAELAYQYTVYVPGALKMMGEDDIEAWLIRAMDAYDTTGLHAAIAVLKGVDEFVHDLNARESGVLFDDVYTVLEIFVHGLYGRKLKIESSDKIFTDTETLFLPDKITRFVIREDNFILYKAMVVHMWAQIWFGSWGDSGDVTVQQQLETYENPDRATRHFHTLERVRLDACISRYLPGMYRQICRLCEQNRDLMIPPGWQDVATRLQQDNATVEDSLELLSSVYEWDIPVPLSYQGQIDPTRVEQVKWARIAREGDRVRSVLAKMAQDIQQRHEQQDLPAEESYQPEFSVEIQENDSMLEDISFELMLDGKPVAPPEEAKGVMSSIIQDLGEIPPEYLVAAGAGAYAADEVSKSDKSQDVWKGTYHEEGAFIYNEWDFKRQHYRKNWCVLREIDVNPQSTGFIDQTLSKHKGLVHAIRRTFEVLRGEDKLLKKQPHGDDIDIDALVEAYGDVSSGMEMTERLFTKKHKLERNIAVMFMVDMSGSTKGWINDAERESLVLLCEALEILGDRYAIYGFSGMSRKRCELYKVKSFDDAYDEVVKGRISGISPRDYTRMGVTIRHLTSLLNEVEARTKLLITLSDGKPDDFDGYRGEYGIEDTRMALIESKRDGIHPFCITIDTEAGDYLPHMYGSVNYTVIDDVGKLPLRVSDIYRRLTT